MITTNNRIEGKKLPGLMLPHQLKTVGILETFPYVNDVPCITHDLALLSVRFAAKWVTIPRTAETKGQPLEEICNQTVTCHACGEKGHYRNQCPKANNNTQGRAYLLRDKNAHRDPNVVTDDLFSLSLFS
ncbi:putative reverse transcriptase domain-containing protein [Tanacetum coccineum]